MDKKKKTRERVQRHRRIKSALTSVETPSMGSCKSGESVDINDSLVGTHRVSNITNEDSTFMNNAEKPPDNENAQSSYLLVSPSSSEQRLESCDSETEGSDLSYGDLPNNQEGLTVNTEETPEIAELRNWAVRYNVPLAHLDALLKILRKRILPSLPRNGKSFLNTSKAVYNVQVMKGMNDTVGEFVYLGIKNGLMSCIDPNVFVDDTIFLQINIDGASPYRSSTKQLWPVLCKVSFKSDIYSPFPVALYYGDTKPGDVHEYMKDFIEEINVLQRDGIFIDDKKYSVQLKHIICDLPARKFLKQVKGHGGYDACERCDVHGKRVGTMSKRVVYPDINCQARSDQSFREQQQQEHHTGLSPLLRIEPPIDMIYAFPLDYMHLCCLGVTKKFYIMDLLFNKSPVKLRANVRDELFKRIVYLKPYVPDEFQRKPRPPVPNLKASELRFIALYAGPIIFKKILNAELYDHFLLFHTAMRILSMKGSAQEYNDAAATYLRSFFSVLPKLYGEQSHVLNAHYLLHLADDVRIGKCTLNDLSAFPFENYLGLMRKSIRSANKPLAQICRRLHEKHPFITKPVVPAIFHILKKQTTNSSDILLKLRYKNCILTTKQPNNLVMLNDRRIIKITSLGYVSESEDDIEISGLHWVKSKSIFKYPTDSADLYMWELRKNPSESVIIFNLKDIYCKMVQMRIPPGEHSNSEKIYVVPLLH